MKLYNGDCLEIMKDIPDKSIDMVITDPPYNISKDNNFKTMGRAGIDFGEWDKEFDLFEWINELPRILTKNGGAIIFNAWKNLGEIAKHCESVGMVIKDMIRWEKTNPMPRNRDRRYVTDYECAIWVVMKNGKWTFNRQSETYERPKFVHNIVSGKEKLGHPTQKPVKLMEDLVRIHTNKNDVVLDPFMGSGSTGIACKNLGREFIGIELDEKYFKMAENRLNRQVKMVGVELEENNEL